MLEQEEVRERLAIQNVGDVERAIRAGVGLAIMAAASGAPRALKWALRIAGAIAALTGISGWCPAYHARGLTSLNGPGDHPDEAERSEWLAASRG
jgi:hypothetical protein